MRKLTLVAASAFASVLLLAGAGHARPHWYWSPAYAEARLADRGLEDAVCRGFGRDRVRAPKGTASRYVFRAFNCRIAGERRGLVVLGHHRFRLFDGPLGPDLAP